MSTRVEYTVTFNGNVIHQGGDAERAVRAWDAATYLSTVSPGDGIAVREYRYGVMVRDGSLLHINERGTPYLNPALR